MNHLLKLKSTQHLLLKLISAPEGVHKALQEEPDITLPIKPSKTLTPEERLDIYANMYFYRILDSLKEDYPDVLAQIGKNPFHNLITDYLIKHPPSHFSLRYAGRYLAPFIKKHSYSKKWPYLFDLATFEWALLEAFDAPDEILLTQNDLQQIPPEQWGKIVLKPTSSLFLLNLQWGVDITREKTLTKNSKPIKIKKENIYLIVWRRNLKVYYKRINSLEKSLWDLIQKQSSFGELCEHTARKLGQEKGVLKVAQYLQNWVGDEMLRK